MFNLTINQSINRHSNLTYNKLSLRLRITHSFFSSFQLSWLLRWSFDFVTPFRQQARTLVDKQVGYKVGLKKCQNVRSESAFFFKFFKFLKYEVNSAHRFTTRVRSISTFFEQTIALQFSLHSTSTSDFSTENMSRFVSEIRSNVWMERNPAFHNCI